MKKLLLGLCLGILSIAGFSQTGLQGVIIEKLQVATAADNIADPNLPVGAVTYRVFLDLNTGWRLSNIFGDPDYSQNIVIKTTSTNGFYNVSLANGGKRYGHEINYASLATGTLKFDTWFAFGGAAAPAPPNYYHGIVKSIANPNGIITLATPTTRLTQTPPAGNDQELILYPMLDGTSTNNDFTSGNISFYDLSEANFVQGPDANNQVLIGQFTTDGDFSYQFNIQLVGPAPARVNEFYVAEYPANATQTEYPALKGTMLAQQNPPTVSGLSVNPLSVIVGAHVALSVTATDVAPGSVSKVEFFRGTTKLAGTVTNIGDVYSLDYVTDVAGTFNIKAIATDNETNEGTSSEVSLTVLPVPSNVPPVVNTLTVPATVNVNSTINGSATASDEDGTIASVQFYVNNIAVGVPDPSSPYEFTYPAPATEQILTIKAVATDNQGGRSADKIAQVTVTDPAGGYKILSQKVTCNTSDFFYVPVATKGSGVANVIGFDMVMTFNSGKVRPTRVISVNKDLIADSLWTSSVTRIVGDSLFISLFLNSNAPANTYFGYTGHNTGKVLSVEFAKTMAFSPADSVVFNVPSFIESYNTGTSTNKTVDQGYYATYTEKYFTGTLKFWADNGPIVYTGNPATSLITNIYDWDDLLNPVQPDAVKGEFVWDITRGLSIDIVRDVLDTTDVMAAVNGYDAYMTQKVLVDDPSFKPNVYQIMSMDVNLDGKVSAGDVSQINQRTVKSIPEFKQKWNYNDDGTKKPGMGISIDWAFFDETMWVNNNTRISTKYPLPDSFGGYYKNNVYQWGKKRDLNVENATSCPIIYNTEYLGIMLGDVDGSYKNIAPLSTPGVKGSKNALADVKAVSEKSDMTEDKVVFDLSKASLSNGYLTFPISVLSENNVNALDFSMKFDLSKLSFESVFNHSNNLQSLAYYNAADQTLRLTSFSLQNYAKDAAIVSLRFKVKSEKISNEDLSSVKGYLNGSPAEVEITKLVIGGTEKLDWIINIYPNPTSDVFNVEISENADIELIDILGRTVSTVKDVNAYQKHEINVESLPQGMYLMKFKMKVGNELFESIRKVVIKR